MRSISDINQFKCRLKRTYIDTAAGQLVNMDVINTLRTSNYMYRNNETNSNNNYPDINNNNNDKTNDNNNNTNINNNNNNNNSNNNDNPDNRITTAS